MSPYLLIPFFLPVPFMKHADLFWTDKKSKKTLPIWIVFTPSRVYFAVSDLPWDCSSRNSSLRLQCRWPELYPCLSSQIHPEWTGPANVNLSQAGTKRIEMRSDLLFIWVHENESNEPNHSTKSHLCVGPNNKLHIRWSPITQTYTVVSFFLKKLFSWIHVCDV